MSEEKMDETTAAVKPSEQTEVQANDQTSSNENQDQQPRGDQDKNWKQARDLIAEQHRKIQDLEKRIQGKEEPPKEAEPQYSPDDVMTYGEFEKWQKRKAYEETPKQYSDFYDVIKLVDEYVAENPAANDAIMNSANPRLTAYQMVKSWYKYREKVAEKKPPVEGTKVKENLAKGSSSQGTYASAPLNEAASHQRMTPQRMAEIRKMADEYASRR